MLLFSDGFYFGLGLFVAMCVAGVLFIAALTLFGTITLAGLKALGSKPTRNISEQ